MQIHATFWKAAFTAEQLQTINTLLSFYHASDPSQVVDYGEFIYAPMEDDRYVWLMTNVFTMPSATNNVTPKKKREKKQTVKEEPVAPVEPEQEQPTAEIAVSPILQQYKDLKAKHPDAILLFRCGDFYETYCEDAADAANILGITLTRSTKRNDADGKPLQMAGFPYHQLDTYLPKLIRAGKRVAICDQIDDPKKTKKQEITGLVTPGTSEPEQTEEVNEQVNDATDEDVQNDVNVEETENQTLQTKDEIIDWCINAMNDAFVDTVNFKTHVKFKNGKSDFQATSAFIKKGVLTFKVTCTSGRNEGRTLDIPSNNEYLTRDNVALLSTAIHKELTL